ncbi:MAG: hypothetical protein R3A52_23320 [Polyangiales bacterium]
MEGADEHALPYPRRAAHEDAPGLGLARAVERIDERRALGLAAVEPLRRAQRERRVVVTDRPRGLAPREQVVTAAAKVGLHATRGLVPRRRVLREQLEDHRVDARRNVCANARKRAWDAREVRVHQRERVAALEGRPAREGLVEHDAQGVQVSALVDQVRRAPRLLRRRVPQHARAPREPARV